MATAIKRLILVTGPPCSGKTTVSKRIAEANSFLHFSSGDIFREEVERGSELGVIAAPYIERGDFVPDRIVLDMILSRLGRADALAAEGILLDGFPRTQMQATLLAESVTIECVIYIDVPDAVLIDRASHRRIDPVTGDVYNMLHAPPPAGVVADRVVRRAFDDGDAFKLRLSTHRRQIRVLRAHRSLRSVLMPTINGLESMDDVQRAFQQRVDAPPLRHDGGHHLPARWPRNVHDLLGRTCEPSRCTVVRAYMRRAAACSLSSLSLCLLSNLLLFLLSLSLCLTAVTSAAVASASRGASGGACVRRAAAFSLSSLSLCLLSNLLSFSLSLSLCLPPLPWVAPSAAVRSTRFSASLRPRRLTRRRRRLRLRRQQQG